MDTPFPAPQEYFDAFIKTAQYVTRLTPKQDILTETGNALVRFYGAGVVGFMERMKGGELTCRHWVNPLDLSPHLFATPEVREVIGEVLETGFFAVHRLEPEKVTATFLPITWENGVTAVMLVAHRTRDPVPDDLLNSYLAIAGLVSTAVASAVVAFTNAAEKKKAEDSLREAREHLAFLVENTPVILYRLHASDELVTTFISENVRAELGYGPEEFVGDPGFFMSLVHPDDRERVRSAVSGALDDGTGVAEYRFLGRDGAWRWMHDEMRVVPAGEAGPAEVLGYRIDISPRKRAEEELFGKNEELNAMNEELVSAQVELLQYNRDLRETEHELRKTGQYLDSLIDYANAPIIVWDPQFRITRFNRAFERLTGRTADDVIGRSLDVLFPDPRKRELMEMIRPTVRGEQWESVEIPIAHEKGEVRTVLWNSATLFAPDGRSVSAVIAQGQDITGRKKAEDALVAKNEELISMHEELRHNLDELSRRERELTESERRYRDLAESGRLLLSSETPEEIVQAICERVMAGLSCDVFFNYLIDETNGRMFLNASAGTSEQTAEEIGWLDLGVAVCGCVARDGERIVAEDIQNSPDERTDLVRSLGITAYACHPLVYQDRPIGTLSFGTRSRTRFTDEELGMMKAVTDLVAMAMARKRAEAALTEYMGRLRESNGELERFAYVASHDLKEPLRAVRSFAQLLERKYRGRIDSDADEYVRYIIDGGARMDALVNDLLEYSRVNSADKPFGPVDLDGVVRTVTDVLRERICEKGVEIEVADLPSVHGDPVQMTQLFQNLVSNAIKFGRENGPTITIGVTDRDGVYELFVRDNGIGIASEHFEKIFEIFKRLHTSEEYPGTGIGLAICRKIVERHGGRIWAESEEGAGSTFCFTIPKP